MQPERRLDDHAERAERAHHELRDVVAGHRFHDLRAAPRDRAIRPHEAHAEQRVAPGPVPGSQRTARVRRKRSADGALPPARRVQGQKLAVLAQQPVELVERHARLDAHGDVRRLVLDDAVQQRQVEHEIDPRRRVTEPERGPCAPRHDHEAIGVCPRQQPAHLVDVAGPRDEARGDAVDARVHGGHDVLIADDGG